METIMFMVVGAVIGAVISEIYHKFEEIDTENMRTERELKDTIIEQKVKIDSLEMELKRVQTDIEAQK